MKACTRSGGVPDTKLAEATTILPGTDGKKVKPMRPPAKRPTNKIMVDNAIAKVAMRLSTAHVTAFWKVPSRNLSKRTFQRSLNEPSLAFVIPLKLWRK